MCSPNFIGHLQASKFELVVDTLKGHTSNFAPSTLQRKRDGSPSRNTFTKTSPQQQPRLSRWDTSSTCQSSPIKPPKPAVDTPPSLKRVYNPPSCTLQNVLKPVRRRSIDATTALDDVRPQKQLDTASFLTDVLAKFTLMEDEGDADCICGQNSENSMTSCHF